MSCLFTLSKQCFALINESSLLQRNKFALTFCAMGLSSFPISFEKVSNCKQHHDIVPLTYTHLHCSVIYCTHIICD
jgi:hypothetical protein